MRRRLIHFEVRKLVWDYLLLEGCRHPLALEEIRDVMTVHRSHEKSKASTSLTSPLPLLFPLLVMTPPSRGGVPNCGSYWRISQSAYIPSNLSVLLKSFLHRARWPVAHMRRPWTRLRATVRPARSVVSTISWVSEQNHGF